MINTNLALVPIQGVRDQGQVISQAGNQLFNALMQNKNMEHQQNVFDFRKEQHASDIAHRDRVFESNQNQLDLQNKEIARQKALQNMDFLGNAADKLLMTPPGQRQALAQTMMTELSQHMDPKTVARLASGPLDDGSLRRFKDTMDVTRKKVVQTAEQANFASKTQGLTPEEVVKARRIDLGLEPRAQGSSAMTLAEDEELTKRVADSQGEINRSKAQGTAQGKGEENRGQDLINRGVTAAEATATIRRSIELLDLVETGGFNAAALRAKQVFGIESADEGELSNSLGKAVLSQLRETFGAAFTAGEGERLDRIEANFGKSPETNKRLLRQALRLAERSAQRGLAAAEERGDTAAMEDIQDLLDFRLDNPEEQAAPTTSRFKIEVEK